VLVGAAISGQARGQSEPDHGHGRTVSGVRAPRSARWPGRAARAHCDPCEVRMPRNLVLIDMWLTPPEVEDAAWLPHEVRRTAGPGTQR
jgi:hypothetical protein